MKKILIITIAGIAALASCKGTEANTAPSFDALASDNDSLSYFLGTFVGGRFEYEKIDKVYEPTAFAKGIKDVLESATLILKKADIQNELQSKFMAMSTDTTAKTYTGKQLGSFEKLNTINDTISYVVGTDVAQGLLASGFETIYSEDAYIHGIHDALMKNDLKINKEVMQVKAQAVVDAKSKLLAKAGDDFLLAKTAEEGVVTLPSGLRYKIINKGTGKKPKADDGVSTHYHGTLTDGTVFDSSVERGKPIEFLVNGVIPGWTEALQLMPEGSKWELYIPYNLAYGERGSRSIPPFSALVFEVELFEVLSEEKKQILVKQQEAQMQQMRQQQMQQQLQQQAQPQ